MFVGANLNFFSVAVVRRTIILCIIKVWARIWACAICLLKKIFGKTFCICNINA